MLGVASATFATALIIAFLWAGPGVRAFQSNSGPALFDEDQVEALYRRASPAVVQIRRTEAVSGFPEAEGAGSGFLIDNDGHIATNNHVVEGASTVRVKFQDGRIVIGKVLGRNPANDLALVKVDASEVEGIAPLPLADSSQVRPGQLAIAIGNPYGLEGSVTAGIISGIDRDLPSQLGRPISGVIQTDAALFPGNSGGPLLNSRGEVVGINTAVRVRPTGSSRRSIGFAVPAATLRSLMPQLKIEGVVQPAWLGVGANPVDATLAERLQLSVNKGVYVTRVMPDSPAHEAGLVESGIGSRGRPASGGDIITAVDGASVTTVADLVAQLNARSPGDVVTLTIQRGDGSEEVNVTLGEWPATPERDTLPRPDGDHPREPRWPFGDHFPFGSFSPFFPPWPDQE